MLGPLPSESDPSILGYLLPDVLKLVSVQFLKRANRLGGLRKLSHPLARGCIAIAVNISTFSAPAPLATR